MSGNLLPAPATRLCASQALVNQAPLPRSTTITIVVAGLADRLLAGLEGVK
ncbi:MAG: hypothetical protein ACO3DT_16265 [Gammaproteobacteria bacterium]